MKSKEKKELHQKSIKELSNLIAEAENALIGLKLDKIQNKLKNTSLLFVKRREIAQMLTIKRLKELAEMQIKKKE